MEVNVKTFSSRIKEAILDNTHVRALKKHVLNHPWITKSIISSKHKKLRSSRNGWKVRPWRIKKSIKSTKEPMKRLSVRLSTCTMNPKWQVWSAILGKHGE